MRRRYRSRNDIIGSILRLVTKESGLGITNIMYCAFLSYRQVTQFLQLLTENDLLKYDDKDGLFRITEKGLQYLELYAKMDDLIRMRRTGIAGSLILLISFIFYPLLPVLDELI